MWNKETWIVYPRIDTVNLICSISHLKKWKFMNDFTLFEIELGKLKNSQNCWTIKLKTRSLINKFYARPGDWSVLRSGRWERQQNLSSGVYLVNVTLPCSNEGSSVLFLQRLNILFLDWLIESLTKSIWESAKMHDIILA